MEESQYEFNADAIGDAQAWRDKHWDLGQVFVADRLVGAIKAAGLTGVSLDVVGGKIA